MRKFTMALALSRWRLRLTLPWLDLEGYLRESTTDESEGSHKFHIRVRLGEQRYEVARADQHDYEQVTAATWTQRFKEQLAVSIAKIVFAREAAQVPK